MNLTLKHKSDNLLIPLIVSITLSLVLFYIDDGYYNFKWMLHWGSWGVFLVYVTILSTTQMLLNLALASITKTINTNAIFYLSGILLGVAILFILLSN